MYGRKKSQHMVDQPCSKWKGVVCFLCFFLIVVRHVASGHGMQQCNCRIHGRGMFGLHNTCLQHVCQDKFTPIQFFIDVVWVDKPVRGKGFGRTLMEQAEIEARSRGCIASQVDTLSFQAPNFYKKLGFEVAGKVCGMQDTPDRYFFVKHY